MSSTEGPESYPSPGRPNQASSLPFYGQPPTEQQAQQGAHDQDDSGRGQDPQHGGQGDGVQDDQEVRHQLTNMMSNFHGAFGGSMQPPYQHPDGGQQLPPGSVAYAQASGSADSPAHKTPRTKVSRACDECRRKKIRCDAVDESGTHACTSCARTNSKCAFSRQPMKRGPSKGYIKELAERLNTLERQVQPGQHPESTSREMQRIRHEIAQHAGMDPFEHSDPRVGDKRTFATAEMLQQPSTPGSASQPSSIRPSPYYPQPPPQPPMQGSSMQPFWRHGGVENRQEHTALSHELAESSPLASFDWDDHVVDEYYRLIHQTFPLLPNNKNRLRQRLADCPSSLREAFLTALDCTLRSFPTTTLPTNPNYAQALRKASELLAKYPFDNPNSHTNATSLVYLQTLLLMALESDNHGPATIRGQAGPSRAEWLGRAAGVAGQLEINVIRNNSQSIMDGDRDSEERLARRVWWVLFILDRWHASSTADLLKLPENSVVLLPEDQMLLGESTYHLARLSFIIGHLAAILTTTKTPSTDVMEPSNPASSLLGLTLAGEIDRFRESVESVWGSLNLVHLSYHHCHLLIKRLNPASEPTDLVSHAVKVATVLNSRMTPVTPLNHHFGALAAMTLCELCDVARTREQALRGLDQLIEALGEGRGLAGKSESEGWDGAIRELALLKRDRMRQTGGKHTDGDTFSSPHCLTSGICADMFAGGLDALADAAQGEEKEYDPTMLTRYGYLTALGQGRFRTK